MIKSTDRQEPCPIVDILLATYNGAEFLHEQMNSLLGQTHQAWRLWIRDDGSTDDTRLLLQHWADDPRIHILPDGETRLGAMRSFAKLLNQAPADGRYFMFCDQDDVWLPHKIAATLARIREEELRTPLTPLIVHCDLIVAKSDCSLLHPSFWEYAALDTERSQFKDLLVQNNVTGCAMMINAAARNMIRYPLPEAAIMHDWWISLVVSAFGRVIPLSEPLIQYRQHERNTVGAKSMGWMFALKKIAWLKEAMTEARRRLSLTYRQAGAFLDVYESALNPGQVQLLQHYSLLPQQGYIARRLWLYRMKMLKSGTIRNVGLLLAL